MKLIEKTYNQNEERIERTEYLVDMDSLRDKLNLIYQNYENHRLELSVTYQDNRIIVEKDYEGDVGIKLFKEFILTDENEIA